MSIAIFMYWTHDLGTLTVPQVSIDNPAAPAWNGHARGSSAYSRLLAALFCAGVATFAQL